jgi:hypothetical protein
MHYRELGKTGVKVSEVSLGCWTMGGLNWVDGSANGWANVDEKEVARAIDFALERGVNHFDNADVYGNGPVDVGERHGACDEGEGSTIGDFSGRLKEAGPGCTRESAANADPPHACIRQLAHGREIASHENVHGLGCDGIHHCGDV